MLSKIAVVGLLSVPLIAQGWVDRTSGNGPAPRQRHGMCYDPVRGYVLMSGGSLLQGGTQPSTETWSWDGTAWTQRTNAPVDFSCLSYHAASNKVLGLHAQGGNPAGLQAYEWDGSQWVATGSLSSVWAGWYSTNPDSHLVAAYDVVRQELVVCPGAASNAPPISTVAVFDGVNWSARTCTSGIPVSGSFSVGHTRSMAWDPTVQKVVLIQTEYSYLLIGSTWISWPALRLYEWNGFGWNLRYPATPPALPGPTATDTSHARIIMLDGEQPNAQTTGANQPYHTWMIANAACTRLTTSIAPAPRVFSAMAFDPVRGVCVLFGGSYQSNLMGDTWEFDLGPLASFTNYGTGCIGSHGIPSITVTGTSTPRVGTTFQATISNLPWTGPAFLLLGLSNTTYSGTPLPIDLGFLGAPGCTLLTSIDDLQPLANILGAATWSFPVPPVAGANFYVQVLPLDPGINALGLTASNGGHGVIGL